MNFTINGLDFGGNTDYLIESPISGLESPPIRNSSQNYSGRDGGIVTGQFYSGRQITITGFIHGTCEFVDEKRADLTTNLPIREDLDMYITTFSGNEYYTSVRVMDIKADIIDPNVTRYKIELYAGDPSLYDSGAENAIIIPKFTGGGFILPVIFPIVFDAGAGATNVTNSGSIITYPTITITGSAHSPEITNTGTGEKIEVGITMSGGDVLIINTKNRTITLNGASVLGYMTSDSTWFDLDVGVNTFIYETTSGSDTGVCVMTWRNASIGI